MSDKRRKTLAWFFALLDASEATYEAATHENHVRVVAKNGRSMVLTDYDLETLSRGALKKRLERLCAGDPPREKFEFVPAIFAEPRS